MVPPAKAPAGLRQRGSRAAPATFRCPLGSPTLLYRPLRCLFPRNRGSQQYPTWGRTAAIWRPPCRCQTPAGSPDADPPGVNWTPVLYRWLGRPARAAGRLSDGRQPWTQTPKTAFLTLVHKACSWTTDRVKPPLTCSDVVAEGVWMTYRHEWKASVLGDRSTAWIAGVWRTHAFGLAGRELHDTAYVGDRARLRGDPREDS